jgi:hypothetical protein
MSRWWADKIGAPGPGVPRRPAAPLTGTPLPPPYGVTPGGFPAPQEQPPPMPEMYEAPDPTDPHGHHRNWFRWRGNPKGGARETQITGNCPQCNSVRYFSRAGAGVTTSNGVVQPRPECFDCGYPNQQGEISGAIVTVQGGARPARQDEAPPPPGSLAHLRRS